MTVLTGIDGGQVFLNDPDGAQKKTGTLAWFNEKLLNGLDGCIMARIPTRTEPIGSHRELARTHLVGSPRGARQSREAGKHPRPPAFHLRLHGSVDRFHRRLPHRHSSAWMLETLGSVTRSGRCRAAGRERDVLAGWNAECSPVLQPLSIPSTGETRGQMRGVRQ